MNELRESSPEKLAEEINRGKLLPSVYFMIISGRRRFLEILEKQNPLFFSVYKEISDLNDYQLAEFITTNIKGGRIVVKNISPEFSLLMSSDATEEAQQINDILNLNFEVSEEMTLRSSDNGVFSNIWGHLVGTTESQGATTTQTTTKTKTNYAPIIVITATLLTIGVISVVGAKEVVKKSKK